MNRALQSSAWIVAALACGALAWFAFGHGPQPADAEPATGEAWTLPAIAAPDLDTADRVWEQRQPWGAPPMAAGAETAAPEAIAIPVGTAVANGKLLAVFLSPDGSLARLKPGDDIAGGGRVDTVTRFHVAWTDARGTKHEQELLADPLPAQVSLP